MTELNYAWSILYCLGSFILIAIYLVASSLVQYWRLRRIPGPPVAAWTNLWLMWHMNSKKTFHAVQKRLHQEYGPMQRYGPNRVMFSDLSAVPIILGTSNIFLKASNHEPLKTFVNGSEVASFVAITDDNKAARLKRNLHSTFSSNGVLVYEAHVDHTVSDLISHLRGAGPTTDLAKWAIWFAFDTMARIAFSEDQGFMSHQEDIGSAIAAARVRFAHWTFYWTIPWLDAILHKNWFARHSRKPPSGLTRLAMRVVERRKVKGGVGTHHDLLDRYMKLGETDPVLYTPPTIIGLTITTIQAGSETTGYTTAICLYCLLKNPRVLAKLRAELESAVPTTASGWTIPSMSILRPLPYLEACVKESNRLCPTINIVSERVVPAGGTSIAGVHIPGGTIVAINTGGIFTDPNIWGPDVHVYRPERWLETNEEQRIKMNRANLLFSAGKRMCLGLNVSWLEMRKVIPALVMNFEMALAYPERALQQRPGVFGEPDEILVHISPRSSPCEPNTADKDMQNRCPS